MLTDSEIKEIRSRFPVFRKKVYLNSCSQGALSDAVEAGLGAYIASWHDHGSPWDLWSEHYEAARRAFAQFIGAEPEEVAIITSVSGGINAIASALDFSQRKRVVMGEFEFPTMGHIWLAQRRRGAVVEFIDAVENRIPAQSYGRAIDRRTLIVPLTRVSFMNGFRSDVEAITGMAHANGALVMLDDYQDCGTRPVDVKTLDVDFYLAGTLKYLLGPSGLAFLYLKGELIHSLTPTVSGWFAQTNPFAFNPKLFDPSATARRFQTGTPPMPNIYAALPALGLLRDIGLENIAGQIENLARALIEGARALGIRLKTPARSVGPLVVLQSKDVGRLVAKLAERNIVASGRHDGLRLSLHVYNTLDDVRAVLQAVGENLELMVSEPTAG